MHKHILAGFVLMAAPSAAGTLIVDPGGGGDYTTIQAALDASVDGDLIIVNPGVYVEELVVSTSVDLIGAGVGLAVLLPSVSNPGAGSGSQLDTTTWMVKVRADNVTITGFTVDGDNLALPAPIDARGGIVTDFTVGTFSGLEVVNVEVRNVKYRGIYAAAGGTGHRFISNTVTNVKGNPLDSVGLFFFGAQGEARSNLVDDCSVGIGFQAGGGGILDQNLISNCDLGILANGSQVPVSVTGNSITSSSQGIQIIAVSTTVSVDSNQTLGCSTGLTLFGLGTGTTVATDNVFDGTGAVANGIFATTDVSPFGLGDLTFSAGGNTLIANDYGVVLWENAGDNTPLLSCTLSSDPNEFNTFTANSSFNVFMSDANDDVDASYNVWGAITPALIEDTLFHQIDDPLLGLIDFSNPVALRLTVDDDGPADFTTLNPAIQALLPGGEILVMPGLYQEDVLVDRSCRITGSGTSADPQQGTTLIGASIHPDMVVVSVVGPDVWIENLRVDGQQPVYGQARRAIYASGTSGLTVADCVIHTATTGIAYVTSTGGTFVRNEVYDFGKSLQEGGGIFLWNGTGLIGTPGNGNYAHNGKATGFLFHNSSSGTASDNLVENGPLGYLSNGSSATTRFEDNSALGSTQGFQAIANKVPSTYEGNLADGCNWGFTLFGLGGQLHTYTDNRARNGGTGFWFTTETVFGDGDVVVSASENELTKNTQGVTLDESASSVGFLMAVDFSVGSNWLAGNSFLDLMLVGCDDDIDASGCYFGSTDPATIELQIRHQVDDPSLGLVDFSSPAAGFVYCVAKVNSQGCVPAMGFAGLASATSPAPFLVTAGDIISNQNGLFFYGYVCTELPFQGTGTLCVGPPLVRSSVLNSGGNGSPDCSGAFAFDMNAEIQAFADPGLVVGASVFGQYWYRDPALGPPYTTGVTDAVTFLIHP
jgi:Right handed beta helix region/Periplasmic copper-binding protein (NosD)